MLVPKALADRGSRMDGGLLGAGKQKGLGISLYGRALAGAGEDFLIVPAFDDLGFGKARQKAPGARMVFSGALYVDMGKGPTVNRLRGIVQDKASPPFGKESARRPPGEACAA